MYALIQKSNSGSNYVYGPFGTKEDAEEFAKSEFSSRGCTWEVVTYFHAVPLNAPHGL